MRTASCCQSSPAYEFPWCTINISGRNRPIYHYKNDMKMSEQRGGICNMDTTNTMLALLSIITSNRVAQWLRCCATNRKVAGSIPNGVFGIFRWHNPSDRTTALGSTQPLTEMSTRKISWGKCGRCVRLTTLPPLCAIVMKSENLNFLEPSEPLQACNGTEFFFLRDIPLCYESISLNTAIFR